MNEIFDMKEENKPQKVMNPKVKKTLIYVLCGFIGLAVAALAIAIFNLIFAGAATPQEAVSEYQKASLIYDTDNMVEYSSDYNKIVLSGNQVMSDRELRRYLNKGYEGYESVYKEENISFKLISVLEYNKGEGRFDEIMEQYTQKVENGSEDVTSAAIVRMAVNNGKSETTRDYVVVKSGFRWFFAYALGV